MEHLNKEVEYPEDFTIYWNWYWELSARKPSGFSGPQPLTYREVSDWSAATGAHIDRDELLLMMNMDTVYRSAAFEELDAQAKRREQLSKND